MSTERQLPRTEEIALLAAEQRTVEGLAGTILLERYRLIELCGAGGASVVYRAEHSIMQKPIAVKILRPELALRQEFVQRFLSEARTVARLRHEHIVDIVDIGRTEGGIVFCVMEWLDGTELGDTLEREGLLPWTRAQHIVLQLCQALAAAHGAGIVHRDIKPQNCFLVRRGADPEFVKLLDFGIAKHIAEADGLTATGMIIGTAEYMSPEQARGQPVDARSDIYSLGAMLFELLSGQPPFVGATFVDVLFKHAYEAPPKLSALVPKLPSAISDIVAAMLAKLPADRPASVDVVANALLGSERRTSLGTGMGTPSHVEPESVLGRRPASLASTHVRTRWRAAQVLGLATAITLALAVAAKLVMRSVEGDAASAEDDGAPATAASAPARDSDATTPSTGASGPDAALREPLPVSPPQPTASPQPQPEPPVSAYERGEKDPLADAAIVLPLTPRTEPQLTTPLPPSPASEPRTKPRRGGETNSKSKWKRKLTSLIEERCTFFGATDVTVTKAAGAVPVVKASQATLRECVAALVPADLTPGAYPLRVNPRTAR